MRFKQRAPKELLASIWAKQDDPSVPTNVVNLFDWTATLQAPFVVEHPDRQIFFRAKGMADAWREAKRIKATLTGGWAVMSVEAIL